MRGGKYHALIQLRIAIVGIFLLESVEPLAKFAIYSAKYGFQTLAMGQ
jgi:hypothetical protein